MKKQLITALLAITACAWAQAATFVVDTTTDLTDPAPGNGICGTGAAGTCSLRAAIQEANALAGDDTIVLSAATYAPSSKLDITSNVTLQGAGAGDSVVSGSDAHIVFTTGGNATVTFNKLTITQGSGTGSNFGGGLFVGSGTTTLAEAAVVGNSANGSTTKQGGGIYVYEFATLNLVDSLVSGNTAHNGGGGLTVRIGATAQVSRSTFVGNSATNPGAAGGGIDALGTLTLTNSTITGNAAANGSGISVGGDAPITHIRFTTIAANMSQQPGGTGGQLGSSKPAAIHLSGSIVANPAQGVNCRFLAGAIVSDGDNLSSDGSCTFLTQPGDLTATNPMLDALDNNGGPTPTHALQAGSPAINTGPTTVPPPITTDQRGLARVQNGRADIGAYESPLAPPAAPVQVSVGNAAIAEGNTGTSVLHFPITLSAPAPAGGITITWFTADGSAAAASDYVAVAGGQITIPQGDSNGSLPVTSHGDTQVEPDETFSVTIGNVGIGAQVGTATAIGTITNDDSVQGPDNPGSGGVQPVPVDNPFALALTALGLLGLALRERRQGLVKK